MSYILAMGGYRVGVAADFDISDLVHKRALERLKHFENIDVLSTSDEALASEVLIFSLIQRGRIEPELPRWRKKARRVLCLPSRAGHGFSLRERCRQFVRSFPHHIGVRQIALRPHVHPQLVANPRLRAPLLCPFDPNAERKYKLCFLGNMTPEERGARLRQCDPVVKRLGEKAYWHVYDETGAPSIAPAAYLDILTNSEFTISPPGWCGYTHRTYEAIMRGSVPIIEDPEQYDVPFTDGTNCLIANPKDWGEAAGRAASLPKEHLVKLQRGLAALRKQLAFEAEIELLSGQIGVANHSASLTIDSWRC